MLDSFSPAELEREEGQTLAEYAMILGLIAVVVVTVVILLGHHDQHALLERRDVDLSCDTTSV